MKTGLYFLSGNNDQCLCRVVISADSVLSADLIQWLRGRVTPSSLVEGLIKNAAEVMVNDAVSNIAYGESSNICSAVAPYLNGLETGQEIPYWADLLSSEDWRYYTVPQDMRFWSAVTDPKRFPSLESSGFTAKLLEIKAIDVMFVKLAAVVRPFNRPVGYWLESIEGNDDYVILYPTVTDWTYNNSPFDISGFYFSNQYASSAYLVLNYRAVITESPLPAWYFLNQAGKEYHAVFDFDFNLGFTCTITNHYEADETPQDCVPFFSADYPSTVAPYRREEGVGYRRLYGYYSRGGLPSAMVPSVSGDRVYIAPTERMGLREVVSGVTVVSLAAELVVEWVRMKRGGMR